MSAAILTAGKLVFAAIGVAVGIKLAATTRDRGALGLHTVALAAICVGGLGMLAMPVAGMVDSRPLLLFAEASVRIGMLLLCVFVAGTFRPTFVGAGCAAVAGLLLVAAIVWDLRAQSPGSAYDYALPSSHANQLSIAVPFLWACIESTLLWVRGRRRLELGLASRTVVRGYLLWSITTACFVGICTLAILAGVMRSVGATAVAEIAHGLRGLLYFAIAASIWLGLFRPAGGSEAEAALVQP